MILATCLIFYYVPPIASLFVGQHFELFGRVWLFNICWVLFWPVLIWVIPWRSMP